MTHGEPFLQPATIVLNAINEATSGNWAAHSNQASSWSPPPLGWLKVNFDGSIHENNRAGLGCTIRNHVGELIAASGVKASSRSVNMTKLRSALTGLTVAKDFMDQVTGIILEGDSASTCSTLNQILSGLYLGDVETKLARLMKECPRLVVPKIDRRANSAADYVANQTCARDFLWARGMPLPQTLVFILSHDSLPM
ncbi:hypothetical protein KSP39_PZI018923 [Platanthera zijinensis]|uniref:RNase H type-1 domain-containing protein n=1 Tax=Platanthera zijinensis TaxID=2320716 RepID=A0AAP0FZ96_9ASPA